jgi:hypothetical protein
VNAEPRNEKTIPVASDSLNGTVVAAQRDIESNDSVAGLDQRQIFLRDICLGSCAIEEKLDLLEEARLRMLIELRTEVFGVDLGGLGESHSFYRKVR